MKPTLGCMAAARSRKSLELVLAPSQISRTIPEDTMQRHVGQRTRLLVNGEAVETPARTLAELIAEQGFDEGAVATARNGDFVPRQSRTEARLAPDDEIEIVTPRQGG
jgi:sulfur carrier protein